MASSDSDVNGRQRSRSRSRSRSSSPNLVDMSTMTDPTMFKKVKSRKKSLPLARHLLKNYFKYIDRIPNDTSTLWMASDNLNENYRNIPRKPFCTGINQICRERDPITKKYVKIPDDGSEDDVYDIVIWHEYPKKKKKKKQSRK